MADALPTAFYATDAEGWIAYFNKAAADSGAVTPSWVKSGGAAPYGVTFPTENLSHWSTLLSPAL